MLTTEQKNGLGIALNEATLLGVEVDTSQCVAAATLALHTLPESGPKPEDTRLQLRFDGVGRVAASLRLGRWDDRTARVEPFPINRLLEIVQSFGGLPVYGWDFIDQDADIASWADRLSFDWRCSSESAAHSIRFFQEGPERHLDLAIWFRTLRFLTPDEREVPLEDVIAGGKRWWDAFYAKDPRTEGSGMLPLR